MIYENNLIIDTSNETVIGKIADIEKYFKDEMIREINDNISFETMKYNFNDMFDLILQIQENEQDAINNECLFEIKECSMGGFTYNIYKKVE